MLLGFRKQMDVYMEKDKKEILSLQTNLERLKLLTEKNKEYQKIYDGLVSKKDADYVWKKWNKIYFEIITGMGF